jgi:hypothetical protein
MKLTDICRYMMEERYYPKYEKTHLLFYIDGNMTLLEYENDILVMRVFFSINEDDFYLFMEVSDTVMLNTHTVKALVTHDRKSIMFCCETMCDNRKSLRKFLPAMISNLKDAMNQHREQMRMQILTHTQYTTASTYVQ